MRSRGAASGRERRDFAALNAYVPSTRFATPNACLAFGAQR